MVTGRTDASLLVDFARGDRGALDALVGRRWAGAYRVALRSLGDPGAAEDAAADAFAALVRSAPRFVAERPFEPWFGAVLLNAIKKQERARRRREHHERRAATARPTTVEGHADLDASRVDPLLRDLPLDLRLPLVLHFYEGRTHAEVAGALGCPVGTASSRIRRGLERLRGSLAGAGAMSVGVGVPSLEALAAALGAERVAVAIPTAPALARLEEAARRASRSALGGALAVVVALATLALGVLLVAEPPEPAAPVVVAPSGASVDSAARTGASTSTEKTSTSTGTEKTSTSTEKTSTSTEPQAAGAAPQERRVVGRIVDDAGAPVADARVTVSRTSDHVTPDGIEMGMFEVARRVASAPPERRVEAFRALRWGRAIVDLGGAASDADGRFAIAVPADVKYLHVTAAATVGGLPCVAARNLNDDTIDAGDVSLQALRRVRVTVTSAGAPAAGADAYLSIPTSDREGDDFWAHAVTDSTGTAVLEDPFGWMGTQTVVVTAPGHAIEAREAVAVGDVETAVAVELVPAVTARLRVTDDAGRPLEGVEVQARAVADHGWFVVARGRTGPEGAVALAGLTAGRAYTLEATAPRPGLLDAELLFTAAEVPPDLVLHAPIALVVTASADAEGFEAREHVSLQRLVNGRWKAAHSQQSQLSYGLTRGGVLTFDDDDDDAPGEARYPRLEPGTYRAIGEEEGCATVVSAPFTLTPGASAPAVALRLAPGRAARGRVVDAAGVAVADASVVLLLGDHEVSLGDTSEDGTFETHQLPSGPLPEGAALVVSELLGPKTELRLEADATWLGTVVIERRRFSGEDAAR